MFNHACTTSANAIWFWDGWLADQEPDQKGIPNRLAVLASKEIAAGEEVKVNYYPEMESALKQFRLFGQECDCGHCPRILGPEVFSDGKGSKDEWRDGVISDLKQGRRPNYVGAR